MMSAFSKMIAFTRRHPVVRGMISYATIWPTSCLIQQTMQGKRWNDYDWMQVLRFSVYGGLFTAPTLYGWVRITTIIWPQTNFKTAATKAIVEQMTYGPFALICFFFGMSLLENKTFEEAHGEVKAKFFNTWKVGVCFWPVIQTFNFLVVHERNRVPFVSACSLVWCCFLAYMHQLEMRAKERETVR